MNITETYTDGLVEDSNISIHNALEIQESYTKPLIYQSFNSMSPNIFIPTCIRPIQCLSSAKYAALFYHGLDIGCQYKFKFKSLL